MYQNAIHIYILDIANIADFPWKNANVTRNQGVCHVIHIYFESSLGHV